jgi:hypothetical protein
MKMQESKNIFRYFSDQFIGSFTGFLIGIWASSLVSHFFATRSIRNLWGLTSNKTLVSKQEFNALEWMASVLVGYIVFEIVLRSMTNYFLPRTEAVRSRLVQGIVRMWSYVKKRDEGVMQEMP